MKKDKVDIVFEIAQVILGIALIFGMVCSMVKCSREQDKKEWNNGYCECGGHWVYEQAVGHAYSTSYLYKCDKCGKTLEVHNTSITEVKEG